MSDPENPYTKKQPTMEELYAMAADGLGAGFTPIEKNEAAETVQKDTREEVTKTYSDED